MSELISYGAGVNSTALAILLVNEGWRGPIVFADTGCDWPETYTYMDYFENEWLRPRGLEITRIFGKPWQTYFDGGLLEYCEAKGMVPLAKKRFCSVEFKINLIGRWAEQHGITTQILGIAADEWKRVPNAIRPLVDRGIGRQGCKEIIKAGGLEVPMKSGCYICPFQPQSEWYRLWREHPDLFERAARLEELATERAGRQVCLDRKGKRPLRNLEMGYKAQMVMELF